MDDAAGDAHRLEPDQDELHRQGGKQDPQNDLDDRNGLRLGSTGPPGKEIDEEVENQDSDDDGEEDEGITDVVNRGRERDEGDDPNGVSA